jgi:hypothetical protein
MAGAPYVFRYESNVALPLQGKGSSERAVSTAFRRHCVQSVCPIWERELASRCAFGPRRIWAGVPLDRGRAQGQLPPLRVEPVIPVSNQSLSEISTRASSPPRTLTVALARGNPSARLSMV